MYNLVWDESFLRKLRKLTKNSTKIEELFQTRIELLEFEPFHPILKTHKLQGKLKNFYSCSLDYSYRLVFEILDKETIQLIDIGSHDEVY
jgi:addiction module RelE/StbE family toxin